MSEELVGDILIHNGVKGMKWGVRKKRESTSSRTERTPEERKARAQKIVNRSVAGAGIVALAASDPLVRATIRAGSQYVMSRVIGAQAANLNRKYGSAPENSINAGLEFARKRFGAYNITTL